MNSQRSKRPHPPDPKGQPEGKELARKRSSGELVFGAGLIAARLAAQTAGVDARNRARG